MNREASWATVPGVAKESDMTLLPHSLKRGKTSKHPNVIKTAFLENILNTVNPIF